MIVQFNKKKINDIDTCLLPLGLCTGTISVTWLIQSDLLIAQIDITQSTSTESSTSTVVLYSKNASMSEVFTKSDILELSALVYYH